MSLNIAVTYAAVRISSNKSSFTASLQPVRDVGRWPVFGESIHVLAQLLGEGEDLTLREWRRRKDIVGLRMSDWPGYAYLLRKKFTYKNTFYDRRPYLDILSLTEKHLGRFDFVISTDVFEHILPPIQDGFDNLLRLLKPGGSIVFSVPYTRTSQTVEHYPGLYEFEILNFRGKK